MLGEVIDICRELMITHPAAEEVRGYISDRISPKGQEEFEIGYFPNYKELSLLTDMFDEKELVNSGLFHYRFNDEEACLKLHSSLEDHNLVMPYKDVYGRAIALVGRSILSDKERESERIPKYRNTKFQKSNHLFGMWRAKNSIIRQNYAFVVEGQFDCITSIMNGVENCVCVGSSSLSFQQFCLLNRYTDRVILLFDNDAAGEKGAARAIEKFGKYAQFRVAGVPDGYKDLDQFLIQEGRAGTEYLQGLASF